MEWLIPHTTTATQVQRHFKKVANKAKRLKKPLTILSNNKPSLVIIDYGQFKKMTGEGRKNYFGLFSDARITDKEIQAVKNAWDKHLSA